MKNKHPVHPLHIVIIVLVSLCISINTAAEENKVELKFIQAGLVDVNTNDKTIKVDLVNSHPKKNFFRENFYDGLAKAYLQKEVAVKLSKAQSILKSQQKNYSLQILDAARPRSVSNKMFEKMKGTQFESYVANPEKGSMHNYGIAVDITIVDEKENEIDMGISPFRKSTPMLYWQFAKLKMGFGLSKRQIQNRKLLSETMKKAGFFPLSHEWWHFNGLPKNTARKKYKMIE